MRRAIVAIVAVLTLAAATPSAEPGTGSDGIVMAGKAAR
jgi:hypothetical protein